jgi:hypothetical protein
MQRVMESAPAKKEGDKTNQREDSQKSEADGSEERPETGVESGEPRVDIADGNFPFQEPPRGAQGALPRSLALGCPPHVGSQRDALNETSRGEPGDKVRYRLGSEGPELVHIGHRQISHGVLTIEALPEEPALRREPEIGRALRVLQRGDGLAGSRRAVVGFDADDLAGSVADMQQVAHAACHLGIHLHRGEKTVAAKSEQGAQLDRAHRRVARRVSEQRRLTKERAGVEAVQRALYAVVHPHRLRTAMPEEIADITRLALTDDRLAGIHFNRFQPGGQDPQPLAVDRGKWAYLLQEVVNTRCLGGINERLPCLRVRGQHLIEILRRQAVEV